MNFKAMTSALILALGGTAAQAETGNNEFYLGTGAGIYYVDIDGVDLDKASPTWRVFGGYSLNKYLSFEGGYTNLFEISDDIAGVDVEMDGSSFDALVRPTLPIGDSFELFGIVGYSWYDWKIRAEFEGESISDKEKDGELLYGLGGSWHMTDRWSLRGEWTNVDVSDADFGMVTASVSYAFR
jgi:OOP family OmpA-OmpF porin